VNIKTTLKTSVAAAALFAVAMPVAEAGNVTNGNGNSLSISGQVSKSLLFMDDGKNSRTTVVDNDNSGTRFRMIGSGQINEAMSVGTAIEMEYQSNASNSVGVSNPGATDSEAGVGQGNFNERRGEVMFTHKQFGTLSLGQGPTASDGSGESDLSGTGMAIFANGTNGGEGTRLRTTNATGSNSGTTTVGSFFDSLDGMSRNDRIRYDTPTFGGLRLATSVVGGGATDLAAFYGGKFGGVTVNAAASYVFNNGTVATSRNVDKDSQWTVSASALHDSGLNIGGTYGTAEIDGSAGTAARDDITQWSVRAGYQANLTSMGSTNFGVQYLEAENVRNNNDQADVVAVGVVQNISDAGTEVYAGATFHSFDRTNTNFEDVTVVNVGARIKF
jgi:hypothetical protein